MRNGEHAELNVVNRGGSSATPRVVGGSCGDEARADPLHPEYSLRARLRDRRECGWSRLVWRQGRQGGHPWLTPRTTTVDTAEVVCYDDPVTITERVAVSAFMAGHIDATRRCDAIGLRIFAAWCHDHGVNLLNVKRPHLEHRVRAER